jgi:hypothetical protein
LTQLYHKQMQNTSFVLSRRAAMLPNLSLLWYNEDRRGEHLSYGQA